MVANQSRANTPNVVEVPITITGTGTTSAEVDLKGKTVVGLVRPSGIASTSITFKAASSVGGALITLADKDNAAFTVTVDSSAGRQYFEPFIFSGVRFITLEAGSNETDETFQLITRPIV